MWDASAPASASSFSPAGLPSWVSPRSSFSSVTTVVEPSPSSSPVPSDSPSPTPSESTGGSLLAPASGQCGTVELPTPCLVELGPDSMSALLGLATVGAVLVLTSTISAVRLLTR